MQTNKFCLRFKKWLTQKYFMVTRRCSDVLIFPTEFQTEPPITFVYFLGSLMANERNGLRVPFEIQPKEKIRQKPR